VDPKLVARPHGLAELHLVRAHEERRLRHPAVAADDQDAGGLGHRLELEDPGHHRIAREMPVEVRLVDRDVLDRHQLLVPLISTTRSIITKG
jgi:hypothetical protein